MIDIIPPHSGSDTSRAAAEAIAPHTDTIRGEIFDALKRTGGLTNGEGQTLLGRLGDTYRPRIVELRAMGLVRDSGVRRKGPSGRAAIVWEAVR